MRAKAYCAHSNIRDHWTLRYMSRCPDQVVSLKNNPQCFSPQGSLVLTYRPIEGGIDLAQSEDGTPNLWCGSTIRNHSANGSIKFKITNNICHDHDF
ncbi:hypothetical protein TNCV_2794481 [Trichonephila clavipes]|nr:hypothetical protein TNCV_2794481 [Trichonephila clavipes]